MERIVNIIRKYGTILFAIVLSLNSHPQILNWAHKAGGTNSEIGYSNTKDVNGNIITSGSFSSSNVDFDPGAGVFTLSTTGDYDIFVSKLSATGQFLWAFKIGGALRDESYNVGTDANGNIFISGYFRGSNVDFDPGAGTFLLSSHGDSGGDPGFGGDIYVAKYNSAGQFLWAINIGGPELYDSSNILDVDQNGDVYFGGYFNGNIDFDAGAGTAMRDWNSGRIFVAKYNSSGQYVWAFNFSTPGNVDANVYGLKWGPSGNIYVTGFYQGNNMDFDPGPGTSLLSSNGNFEFYVAKYTSGGQFQWAKTAGGPGLDVARSLVLDNAENVYVVGDYRSSSMDFDLSSAAGQITNSGAADIFFVKYNSSGQNIFAYGFGGTNDDYGLGVTVDNINAYIGGAFSGSNVDFDPTTSSSTLNSNGGTDIFYSKYLLNGEFVCAFNIGGSGNDQCRSLVSTGLNKINAAGFFQSTNTDFDPSTGTTILSSAGSHDSYVADYTWPNPIPPNGTLAGNTICVGETGQLTFNATAGTGPFIITYNNGTTNIVVNNVQSGVPFNVTPNPTVTTAYTLVSIRDAQQCSPTTLASGTATVTVNVCNPVTAGFTAPDTVCVNDPVNITNTSVNATSYYWNFCVADINTPPIGANLGNVGGLLSRPVYIDYVMDGGNYYGFLTNNVPGKLLRLNFGSSLLNTPTVTDLGNVGGIIPNNTEGLQIVKNEGKWYVIIVGGDAPFSNPSIVKIELGPGITNNSPVGTNWGNLGNLAYPHDLYIFSENSNWYGFTVNTDNNTITRFDFTTSFSNVPIATNLGNIGNLNGPTGLHPIKDNNNWHLFVTNALSNTLTRLDFGTSLLSTPTGQNLGNINGLFHVVWDIYIIKFCGKITGFAINGDQGFNDLIKLDFGNNLLNTPTAVSFGNIGNMYFPHCISKIFRVGADLYSFVPNVDNNTLTRLRFTGCTNSSIPNSTAQNPPPVTYNTPGTYNINLTIDDGLPTQSSFCKQVVVKTCVDTAIINDYTPVLSLDPCKNIINVGDASEFNVGDTVLLIQMKGAVIDSSNTASFGNVTNYKNAGNYEYNYVKSKTGNSIELLNTIERQYDLPYGKVQLIRVPYFQNYTADSTLTCLPWNGSIGGVLAFNVQNNLTLNTNIDVTGRGFSGGQVQNTNLNATNCYTNNYFYPNGTVIAATKGESIATISNNISSGKGAAASAGGGGNDHNSGGGGGGNATSGGLGGYQLYECNNTFFDNRGIGGRGLLYSNASNKIFMGGGGGAGHCNNGFATPGENTNYNGGNGGGIVLITANTITGNNYGIIARGDSAFERNSSGGETHDGMGGGGAGGTVLISANNYTNNLNINVRGGKGGDMHASMLGGHIGPGGGGAGGVVWVNQPAIPANITINNTGGRGGYLLQENNNPYGTTPGSAGINVFNLQIPIDDVLFKPNIDSVRIKDSILNCNSFDFKGLAYTNTNPIASWLWYFGDGGTGNTQNTTHSYATAGSFLVKLVITDINGCKDSVTTNVLTSLVTVNAGNDTTICSGQSVLMQASTNGGTQFQWSNGSFLNNNTILNPLATPPSGVATTFIITATNSAGCSISDSVDILVKPQTVFSVSTAPSVCINDSIQLNASGGDIYSWSPASSLSDPTIANPVASPLTSTNYSVTITENTCNETATLIVPVTVLPLPVIDATRSNDIDCIYDFADLNATGASTYSWSPAGTLNNTSIRNPRAKPTATTQYIVKGTDNNGCSNYDSVIVKVDFSGKGNFLMPNAFTPNNDGLNDCFGIKLWGVLEEVEFNIYNRWGELIFHTTDVTKCWDGKWKGKEQSTGVFVYWVRAKSKCEGAVFRKGTVVLIR